MDRSRIPQFYKYSVLERLEILKERNLISTDDFKALCNGRGTLTVEEADKMVENVIGIFSLPIGLGLNFLVNGKDYIVPMVVEEPSIIAAVSSAAKIVRQCGGFKSESTDPVLIEERPRSEITTVDGAAEVLVDLLAEGLEVEDCR